MAQRRRQFLATSVGASIAALTGLTTTTAAREHELGGAAEVIDTDPETDRPDLEHTWASTAELDDWRDEGWGTQLEVNQDRSVDGTQAVRSTVPDGSRAGPHYHRLLGSPDTAHLRYHLYLPAEYFPATDNFKLPGLAGVGETGGWPDGGYGGTETNGSNGWSARLELRGDEIGPYTYHADMNGYGDWERAGTIPWDTWVQIDQYVRLNTPGQHDGEVGLWIDGDVGTTVSGIRFRDDEAICIESIWHSIHHGGNADVSLPEIQLWIDNYQVWFDRDRSSIDD